MKNGPHFGIAVRQARKELGITQRQMADRMNISQGYLCDLERGRKTWSEDLMRAAARCVNRDIGGLFKIADSVHERDAAA